MKLTLILGGFLLLSLGLNVLRFRYFLNLWYGFDCFLNAVFAGDPRETISSRWGKAINRSERLPMIAAKILFLTAHFEESVNEGVGRHRVPFAMAVVGVVWLVVLGLWLLR